MVGGRPNLLLWFNVDKTVISGLSDVWAGSVQTVPLGGELLNRKTKGDALVNTLGAVLERSMEYTPPKY